MQAFKVLVVFHVRLFPGGGVSASQIPPSRSKGCLFRVVVGFHVGLFRGKGARPLQTTRVEKKNFSSKSTGCQFRFL